MYNFAMKTIKQEQENARAAREKARAEARKKTVVQLRGVYECENMFMKCVESPLYESYFKHASGPEEEKFFKDAATVYGSMWSMQNDARLVNKQLQEPHKRFVTSHDPMSESEKMRLYESMKSALQAMRTAMQADIVKILKTFEYKDRTYDMEHILNIILEDVEEEIKLRQERAASRKRPHDDSVGGVGGLRAPSSVSKRPFFEHNFGMDSMDFFYSKCLECLQYVTELHWDSEWCKGEFETFQRECVRLSSELEIAKRTEVGLNKWQKDLFDAHIELGVACQPSARNSVECTENDHRRLEGINRTLDRCGNVIKEMLRILNPEEDQYKIWYEARDREQFLKDIGFLKGTLKPTGGMQTLLAQMQKLYA
jgi:hypothetical protein